MKGLLIILLCVTASNCSPLRSFVTSQHPQFGQSGENAFLQSPYIKNSEPVNHRVEDESVVVDAHFHDSPIENADVTTNDSHYRRPIAIVAQDSEVNPDGSFTNVWESENGIKVHEVGTVKANAAEEAIQSVRGEISYIDADGTPIHLSYVADENGFQPQGDHLPTPPPLPLSVARALEYIAAHPYVEQHADEGSNQGSYQELPVVEDA